MDTPVVDEAALVERAKTDPVVFGLLYERYVDKIYNYVYYRTGNHHDAEDLTARVFYQAMHHIPRFVQRGRLFLLGCIGSRTISWRIGIVIIVDGLSCRCIEWRAWNEGAM